MDVAAIGKEGVLVVQGQPLDLSDQMIQER